MEKMKSRLLPLGVLAIAMAVLCATGCKDIFDSAETEDSAEANGGGVNDSSGDSTSSGDGSSGGSSSSGDGSSGGSGDGSSGDSGGSETGYGPYTSGDGYLTVEGTSSGILIKKTNPDQDDIIMVCVWEDGASGATYEAYNRVFYNSSDYSTDADEFTYEYVREGAVYGVMLCTWEEDWGGTEFQSEIAYVRAAGGLGDFREVIKSASYDSDTTTLSFDVELEAPSSIDKTNLRYTMYLYPDDEDSCTIPVYSGSEAKTEFDLSELEEEYEGHIKGNSFTVGYSTGYTDGDEQYSGNIMTSSKQTFADTNE